jgi:hypothetical protein
LIGLDNGEEPMTRAHPEPDRSGIGVSGTELFATIGRRVLGRGGAGFAFP